MTDPKIDGVSMANSPEQVVTVSGFLLPTLPPADVLRNGEPMTVTVTVSRIV